MRVLDLFCGAGGASIGYAAAGHQVIGVDLKPQPHYPFPFVQADALQYLDETGAEGFDLVHASPPCQGYSSAVSSRSSRYAGTRGKDEPRMIAVVRSALRETMASYVIENVAGAFPFMQNPVLLCGVMFGLPIARHRYFESDLWLPTLWHPSCSGVAAKYAETRGWDRRDMTVTGKGRHAGTTEKWRTIMGWPDTPVTQHELREAIPPAYTEWIGAMING
jgi:DNA (cytosine-5)-methyltransferase 1